MTSPALSASRSAGAVLASRYQLDQLITSGSLAEVWQGSDLVLRRDVAIKVLHQRFSIHDAIVQGFRQEAITAARLSHPNVVPTFDAGSDGANTFIISGLVSGPSLDHVLEARQFSSEETIRLGIQVAHALSHAHSRSILHRDLKPSNLLLSENNQRVQVSDFGISRALQERLEEQPTLPEFEVRPPTYLSPEQLNGDEASVASDIYALGVILHEMICGHFVGSPPKLAEDVPLLLRNCTGLEPELATVLNVATESQPTARYSSAAHMALALQEISAPGNPINNTRSISVVHATPQEAQPTTTVQASNYTEAQRLELSEARNAATRLGKHSLIVTTTLILVAVILGLILGSAARQDETTSRPTTLESGQVSISRATAFDPHGDRTENNSATPHLLDNDATTSWSTETYASRTFGNLKPGVGIILTLDKSVPISRVEIDSPSTSWNISIYVNNTGGTSLTAWGPTKGSISNAQPGTTSIQTPDAKGSRILVWITDLGTSNRLALSEIRVYK